MTDSMAVMALMLLSALIIVFRRPLAALIRLVFRSLLGLGALAVGQAAGLSLGVNIVNALILGVLGVPGFGLLLLVQWVFR